MSERKYQIFRAAGNDHELLDKLFHFVRNNNLEEIILRVCMEKRSRSSWEKYMFLQIDEDYLEEALGRLHEIGYAPLDPENPISINQIKSMISSEIKFEDFIRKIAYNPLIEIPLDDPFSYEDEISGFITESTPYRDNINHLLYWCSAKGEGSWQLFHKSYIALNLTNSSFSARQLARRLHILGYIQFFESGSKWVCSPPAIAQVSADTNRYFLLGQRVPNTMSTLEESITLDASSQSSLGGPDCISFSAGSDSQVQELADQISLEYIGNISEILAEQLPTIHGYQESLESVHIEPYAYQAFRWIHNKFQESIFGETGLYQLSKTESNTAPVITAFFDAEKKKWYRGDWYGLRFLSLHKSQSLSELRWENNNLAVPYFQRLPDIYEKVLVLTSGKLPSYKNKWFHFENVSFQIAQKIAEMLQLDLVVKKG